MALSTTNVSTTVVSQAIGVSTHNVGALCTSNKINKWSKYKPVNFSSINKTENWYKSNDLNCGLNINIYTTINAMIADVRAGNTTWSYIPPSGGANSPYRLGDFAGYNHSAVQPFNSNSLSVNYYKDIHTSIGVALDLTTVDNSNLSLNDIGSLTSYYFAIAIVSNGTNTGNWLGCSSNISNSGSAVSIPLSTFPEGKYDIVYFLAKTTKANLTDSEVTNTFIPLPLNIQTINIYSSAFNVLIEATINGTTITYTLYIENNSSVSKTFTNCYIRARYGNKNINDVMVIGEKSDSISNITVAGNSTYTLNGTMTNALSNYSMYGGYMLFSSSELTRYTPIEEIV